MKILIFLKYFISIFRNLKHIQSITTVKQILPFSLHAIYLLTLVSTRASPRNWKYLARPSDLVKSIQKHLMLLWFAFIISVFYLFKVSKQYKNKTLQQRNAFKLLCYFKLTKLKEVRLLVIRWPDLTYCK